MNIPLALAISCLATTLPLVMSACETTDSRSNAGPEVMGNGIDHSDIEAVLDAWHHDASIGDLEDYIGLMTEGAVFMGTDANERWTRKEFREFAAPHFADGHGWTYHPRNRYIRTNAYGDVAWIDEILDHDSYGVLRGTAVMRQNGDYWRIAHYSLTFLIPNEVVGEVIEVINDHNSASGNTP